MNGSTYPIHGKSTIHHNSKKSLLDNTHQQCVSQTFKLIFCSLTQSSYPTKRCANSVGMNVGNKIAI
ncbi:Uncharacterized protein TCM_039490 [Theobroma cacao]|uniref:Uncharacterized protein n=1 Tax=Theobroma cacao TaxID=3641 RepID=A0A061GRA5_THECC|nr:Uncharacterized protein TCM_039490 [Theobroma cacao]